MNNPRPVRVLHIIDGLAGGGCERWLWDIVRLSEPDKFAHHVVTIHPDSGDYVYADRLRALGVYHQSSNPRVLSFLSRNIQDLAARERLAPVRKIQTLMWRLGSYCLAARELLKALVKFRPDVIHAHTYNALIAGLMVKAVTGKPLIHTVPAAFSQMKDAGHGWMPTLYARMHAWVDSFCTGTSSDELPGIGVPATRVLQIRCGVDLEAISAVKREKDRYYTEIRHSLGLPEGARIALSVGRLHPSKGHLFALESLPALLHQFTNLHWVVLGEGLQRLKLEARARELKVTEHVHLIGFRPDPLPFYAAANIYLRTMVFEGENLSSFPAIAMGLPVVGFDTGHESELITKVGHGILAPNRDGAAFARAVAHILMLPDGGLAMGELGAEYSRQHLGIWQIISPFFSVYTALGNRRRGVKSGIAELTE